MSSTDRLTHEDPRSSGEVLLDVVDLKVQFPLREGTVRAVDGVSFTVRRGRTLGIVGESGCGKSVTAMSILRILPKTARIAAGRIVLHEGPTAVDIARLPEEGREIRRIRSTAISMVFQEPMTSLCPVYTIGNQIVEAIEANNGIKWSDADARDHAVELLRRVGMPKADIVVDEYPFNLSGGMRQRALIAMALAGQPSLLIADEPTTAVDVTLQAQIIALIRDLQRELHMALVIITHDLGVIAETADMVVVMYLGRAVERAPVDSLFHDAKHPYTKGLLESVPVLGGGAVQSLRPIRGSVPSFRELPKGCPFHPRCDSMMPGLCDVVTPPSIQIGSDHDVSCFLYGGSPDNE